MDNATRHRIEQGVKVRLAHALNEWYASVYAHVRTLRKQGGDDDVDWKEEWHRFHLYLVAAMLWASEEMTRAEIEEYARRGRQIDFDAQTVLAHYEVSAGNRLRRIGDTTERNTRLEIQRWQASGEEELAPLIERMGKWYDEARAGRIANAETGWMRSDCTHVLMRVLGAHRWKWKHGEICETGPCEAICAPMVGRVFTLNEMMPPASSHIGCDCYGEPVDTDSDT